MPAMINLYVVFPFLQITILCKDHNLSAFAVPSCEWLP